MSLKTVWSTIEFAQPAMLDLAGLRSIDDFANAILSLRSQERSFGNDELMAPISDAALQQLLRMAYYASETQDEARFPAFRLVIDSAHVHAQLPVRFDPVIRLSNIQPLRRLSHACTSGNFAMLISDDAVGEDPPQLVCPGFVPLGRELAGTFRVWVRGPGHVVAGDSIWQMEIHAGQVRSIAPLSMITPFNELTHALAYSLDGLPQPPPESDSSKFAGPKFKTVRVVQDALFRILRLMIARRHGGSVVILPPGITDPASIGIACKYPSSGVDLLAVLKTSVDTDIRMACSVIAELTAVDGCLVLTRDLKLAGFGGEIRVSDDLARASTSRFTRLSGEVFEREGDYDAIMESFGGTRHRSAARLCRVLDGVLVFVVSQDSDLKLICNHENGVYPYGPLDPRHMGDPPE